ncbi:MAG: bifunctional chorismate mutase/prephenate dehydratase [Candidatus Eisenbacteria bacterium]
MQETREAIEAVDRRLLELLKERIALVEEVARAKLASASPLRDPQREDHVLHRVRALATELGLDARQIEALYRRILDVSVAHQQAFIGSLEWPPLRVAYQGVEGSYSHLAARSRYAGREGGALLTGFPTFREAVDAVRGGATDLALLPIENTTAGAINETYDLLSEGGIVITAELVSHVEHCLLALPGVEIGELRTVISHPQALAQCETFLRGIPGLRPQPEFDTAGAARKVRDAGDRTLAAIASESAGALFGLQVLRHGIQTQAGNFTRFVELAREAGACPPGIACKTSLLLTLEHRAGALGRVLTCFGDRGVSLTRLESRPIPGRPWEYRFYLDIAGRDSDPAVRDAVAAIGPLTTELRLLGTYPEAGRGAD